MLIHGFGEDSNVWKNQIGHLKDKFQLIIPDLPGSGKSEMTEDMSMEGMAEVIKQIMDTEAPSNSPEGGEPPSAQSQPVELSVENEISFVSESSKVPPSGGFRGALIGHSMGGYITLAFVEKYPSYLSAFGLFHSSAYADSEEKKAIRRKGIEFINENGPFEFLKNIIPNLFSPNSLLRQAQNQIPNSIKEMINQGHNFSPAALVSYYEAMIQRPDRTELLRKTTVPVLFIMGKYDTVIPLEDGLKQCHLPENSYIHILDKSSHMGMLEEPEKSNLLLKKFLRET